MNERLNVTPQPSAVPLQHDDLMKLQAELEHLRAAQDFLAAETQAPPDVYGEAQAALAKGISEELVAILKRKYGFSTGEIFELQRRYLALDKS